MMFNFKLILRRIQLYISIRKLFVTVTTNKKIENQMSSTSLNKLTKHNYYTDFKLRCRLSGILEKVFQSHDN
jgi:hypothetical protein